MSYQPSSAGGSADYPLLVVQEAPRPPALRTAVRLMWAGAGVALIGTILTGVESSKIRTATVNALLKGNSVVRRQSARNGGYTLAQVHTIANVTVVAFVVAGFVSILLWVWMAWANSKGSGGARIVASVLFALMSVELILARSRASVILIFIVLEWLIGLIAVLLLWRRETTQYIGAA